MPERKDNFWKRLGSSLTNATLGAAMADSPAVMTASGWTRRPDGSIVQESQSDEGVVRLRDNLSVLGKTAAGITAGGLVSAYGIKPSFRALMNGLDYTMPSHWTTKLAAKLALPYESAQGIGYAADMLVPATGHFSDALRSLKKKQEAVDEGDQEMVDYYKRRGVASLLSTAADFIVPPAMEGAIGLWRKSRNLRNLSNAGVLGKYGDVANNLALYHSGTGEGWNALNAMKNTKLEIVDRLKDGVADYSPGLNKIRIPRKSHSYLELGPEYAEALMAHEGTHAIFDSWNLPLRSPVSVIGHGYYVPNASNPLVGSFAPLVKSNRLGAWEASPEEFIAEMGFLRQLTGQNKIYTELSPFYKKRFNKYMSDRFNISKKEASDIMTSISGYYSDGGKLRGLAERLKARKDGAELVNKFKCGGKKYPGGGKIDTDEYPTSSTSAYLRGLSDYVLRRKTPKSFVESEYRPTIGDDGEKYYTRPWLKNEVALNLFGGADYGKGVLGGNYFYRDFDDAYNSISGHPLNRDMRATSNGTLGRYSVTAGMDDKGRYLSFTDKFDHVFIPGKPIHIYDRIYENEVPALYNANDSAINLGDALSRSPLLKNMKSSSENKYPGGGKFFRTNLQNESPMMYQPILPSVPDVPTPMRYEPQPHLGLYEYPASTGMAESYPVTLPPRVPTTALQNVSAPEVVEVPAENLFSDEMIARRALKQRYAESAFNDKAKSKAGAQGAWQIMPITLKDYLGRGSGKTGDLNDPVYNRKVRDWVMGIIPRDLQEFWSESDSDRAKLAKLYAAYNWGAGNLRGFLRKKQKAGVDISNPDNWVDDLNPETRRYVKYLAFDEDIPDSTVYTNAAFERAAADRGYAEGGSIHIAPSKRGTFTAAAKKHGKSVQAFASQVLAHKENYSPAMVKKANFARNAAKWHSEGGLLQRYSPEQIRDAISKIRK